MGILKKIKDTVKKVIDKFKTPAPTKTVTPSRLPDTAPTPSQNLSIIDAAAKTKTPGKPVPLSITANRPSAPLPPKGGGKVQSTATPTTVTSPAQTITSGGSSQPSDPRTGTFMDPANPVAGVLQAGWDELSKPHTTTLPDGQNFTMPSMLDVAGLSGVVTAVGKAGQAAKSARVQAQLSQSVSRLEKAGMEILSETTLPRRIAESAQGKIKIGKSTFEAIRATENTVTFRKKLTIIQNIASKFKNPLLIVGLVGTLATASGGLYLFGRNMIPNEASDEGASLNRAISQAEKDGDIETARELRERMLETRDMTRDLGALDSIMDYPKTAIHRAEGDLMAADSVIDRMERKISEEEKANAEAWTNPQPHEHTFAEEQAMNDAAATERDIAAREADQADRRKEKQLSREEERRFMQETAQFWNKHAEDKREFDRIAAEKGRNEAAAFWKKYQEEKEGGLLRPGVTFAKWNKGKSGLKFGFIGGQSE